MRPQPDFIHEFVPGASNQTLLLLHGTGSNERDLIPLGRRAGPFIRERFDRRRTLYVRRASLVDSWSANRAGN